MGRAGADRRGARPQTPSVAACFCILLALGVSLWQQRNWLWLALSTLRRVACCLLLSNRAWFAGRQEVVNGYSEAELGRVFREYGTAPTLVVMLPASKRSARLFLCTHCPGGTL